MYIYIHINVCVYVHICIYIHKYMHTYICVQILVYTYIYIYICVHINTQARQSGMGWLRLVGSLKFRSLSQKSLVKETILCKRDL